MNSFSHLLIGRLLYTYLHENYGVTLCQRSFLLGNILPDFTRRYKRLPHEPAFWEAYVRSEMTALIDYRRQGMGAGRQFSRRLGVLCHFLADYFCYPHTEGFEAGSYPHIRYEWALYRFTRKNLRELPPADFGALCDIGCCDPGAVSERTYSRFEKLYGEYLGQPPSYANDLLFTLSAGTGTAAILAAGGVTGSNPAADGLLPDAAEA